MPSSSWDDVMHGWDPHAARWRLQCHQEAAESLLAGHGKRRTVRPPTRELSMPLEDAQGVVDRVRSELLLRKGLDVDVA